MCAARCSSAVRIPVRCRVTILRVYPARSWYVVVATVCIIIRRYHSFIFPFLLTSAQQTSQLCRCGKSTIRLTCLALAKIKKNTPGREWLCERVCGKKMTCGRHKCAAKCCIADVLAGAAAAEPHVCDRPCNTDLDCGFHKCPKFCHLGFCAPCNVEYRDGIACPCGKTRLPGVVKCGTPPPPCRHRCGIARKCPHPCAYNCHPGTCPPWYAIAPSFCLPSTTSTHLFIDLSTVLC